MLTSLGDCASSHNHCPSHQFFLQGISWLLLFDVVGRRQRSPSSYPPSLPGQKSIDFCFTLDFILFHSVSLQLTQLSCKNTHFSFCSFVYLCGVFGGYRTHDGRTISVTPAHTSLVSNRTHILFVNSSVFCLLIIWLATFVSIVLPLEFVCASFHHTYATLPLPSHSSPLRFAFRSILLAFSWGSAVRTTAHGRG